MIHLCFADSSNRFKIGTILSMQLFGFFLSSHSHMTITVQPSSISSLFFLSSRSMFLRNLSFQNSVLDFGKGRLQYGHLCQKHPLMKIATFLPGYAISGLPGAFFQFKRYPGWPDSLSILRRISSGFVSFPLLDLMTLDTVSLVAFGIYDVVSITSGCYTVSLFG